MITRKVYSNDKWFFHHFGFDETVDSVYKNIVVKHNSNTNVEIISNLNKRSFNAGLFNLRSPSDYVNLPKKGNGKFHIIHGYGVKPGKFSINDIVTNQNNEAFDGATFQAASNFNCLEFPSTKSTASHGISNYACDLTQGPLTAIVAPASILYRNYFYPHDGKIGQIDSEIELLKRTPIPITHGKATISKSQEKLLKKSNFDWTNEDNYLVGVHENCQVTTNRADPPNGTGPNHDYFQESEPGRISHQVYASSFNFRTLVVKSDFTFGIVRNLLRSEYKSTILAALDHSIRYPGRKGSNKCVLTFVGGLAFGNPIELICKAITDNEKVIMDSGLNVYINCFDEYAFSQAYPHLKDLMLKTGGKIIEAI
ncbi:hypothetical protein GPJ56_003518 [Histomonas meleagridis]|uniref:Uncharacterized protein n=1 Tax=Histomonas meleagridis TaxID=135588 RepID=UPI00355992C3|nr:hypothetical protein GPJ56_003518 [Histomonas meleagridis]KAH0806404.1 Uncharacterized protein GO595_000779 [Histomonas meleagridis]